MVVRQDLEYLKPIDFRTNPYEVGTAVAAIGNRSFTLAAEIRDPAAGTVYATARTVVVGESPLRADQRGVGSLERGHHGPTRTQYRVMSVGSAESVRRWSKGVGLQSRHRAWVLVKGVDHRVRRPLHVIP